MSTAPGAYRGLLDRYRHRLPITEYTPIVNLYEGNTPLLHLENIPRQTGIDADIWVKYEGLNPTGSFKDRGMAWASLPKAILPSGMSTNARIPARAA